PRTKDLALFFKLAVRPTRVDPPQLAGVLAVAGFQAPAGILDDEILICLLRKHLDLDDGIPFIVLDSSRFIFGDLARDERLHLGAILLVLRTEEMAAFAARLPQLLEPTLPLAL